MRNNQEKLLGIKKPEDNSAPQQNLLSFVIPTEYVDLPSKGKLYPVGHPLRDKTSIEIKQMTAKEEDILTSENYIKKGVVLEKLIEAILIDKTIKPETIATIDRAAIFLATRILAYGHEYKAQAACPTCNKQKSVVYNLSEEPVVEFAESIEELSDNGTRFFELPSTKINVECRPMYGVDESKEISKDQSKNKNDSAISDQLNSIIVSMNTVTDRSLIQRAIDVLPAKDSKFLRENYRKSFPNLKFAIKLDCECGFTGESEVPITLEFFWPK